jgi:hypothetical protein
MLEILQQLRHKVAVGFIGGGDLAKQQEQLGSTGSNGILVSDEFSEINRLLQQFQWRWRGQRDNGLED